MKNYKKKQKTKLSIQCVKPRLQVPFILLQNGTSGFLFLALFLINPIARNSTPHIFYILCVICPTLIKLLSAVSKVLYLHLKKSFAKQDYIRLIRSIIFLCSEIILNWNDKILKFQNFNGNIRYAYPFLFLHDSKNLKCV